MLAFLARTPIKLAMVDRRRHRELERSALAQRIGLAELVAIAALGAAALLAAGWHWLVPVAIALPLFGVEFWYDVRSRGRRLVPELCGAILTVPRGLRSTLSRAWRPRTPPQLRVYVEDIFSLYNKRFCETERQTHVSA